MKQPKVENKIVLISGGTSGVGKAAAISLAKAGAEVIILGHRQSRADAAVAEIQRRSNNPLIWPSCVISRCIAILRRCTSG